MNIFRFLDWKMYRDAKELNKELLLIANKLPLSFRYSYKNQLTRAGLSVCLNIAEGAGRRSDPDMCRFFDIALGSLAEVIACLDCLKDEGYVKPDNFKKLYDYAENVAKQICGLKNSSRNKPMLKI